MRKIAVEIEPKDDNYCGKCSGRRGSATCWHYGILLLRDSNNGKLMRLPQCLAAEVKEGE